MATLQHTASSRWTFLSSPRTWFLAPAVAWGLIFTIYPVVHALILAFQRARMGQDNSWAGVANFARVWGDPQFWTALRFTVLFVVITVTVQVVLGLVLALVMSREMPLRDVIRAILILPIFATPVGIGYLGIAMFQEGDGPINQFLMGLGGLLGSNPALWDVPWRSDPLWASVAVGLMDVWQWMPFCFLILLAGIQGIPEELYESAYLDTESRWQLFRHITLPLLRPILGITILLRLIEAWKIIDVPFAFSKGGPGIATQTYTMYVWRNAFTSFDLGYASALGILFLILVLVVVNLVVQVGDLRSSLFQD
jgi:multiple sugar transport system permease protein